MTDTLKDIPVFVAAVEAGSFAQAAIVCICHARR
jgi:DNA-binding transcriptional LysR family regulator